MLNITDDNVLELLEDAVNSEGRDFRYNPEGYGGCFYTPRPSTQYDGDDPRKTHGCLIGTMLMRNGMGPETDPEVYEFMGSALMDANELLRHLNNIGRVNYTYNAGRALREAQIMQDNGHSWGEAYDMAKDYLEHQAARDTDIAKTYDNTDNTETAKDEQ